jgi:hypothetical protein
MDKHGRKIIHRYGENLMATNNRRTQLKNVYAGDGILKILNALFTGVIAAKEELLRLHLNVKVGFNAVVSFDPVDNF